MIKRQSSKSHIYDMVVIFCTSHTTQTIVESMHNSIIAETNTIKKDIKKVVESK